MEQLWMNSRSIEQLQKEKRGYKKKKKKKSTIYCSSIRQFESVEPNTNASRRQSRNQTNGLQYNSGDGERQRRERKKKEGKRALAVKECSPICTRLPKNLPANSWSPNCHFTRGLLSWKPRPRKPPLVAAHHLSKALPRHFVFRKERPAAEHALFSKLSPPRCLISRRSHLQNTEHKPTQATW